MIMVLATKKEVKFGPHQTWRLGPNSKQLKQVAALLLLPPVQQLVAAGVLGRVSSLGRGEKIPARDGIHPPPPQSNLPP
jgi:hypothetical protein